VGSRPEKVIENWWEVNAKNMRESGPANDGGEDVSYGMFMPPERKLNLLGELTGRSVIDLGCGAGDNSVLLAKRGATVTGLDISNAQLEIAKALKLREGVEIDLVRTSVWDLSSFRSEGYDVAFSVWALQFVKDLESCFSEVCRVLRPSGIFVFSIAHPLSTP
jgi:2-polyprenyl-3-methyl-5-hydroxy-6-metoxy-1,4-benzoquinol methylase